MKHILVTGGAGFIGSHVCKSLKAAGHEPITFDNLSHGNAFSVKWGPLFEGDLQNEAELEAVFSKYQPDAVIHLAGCIDLRESVENPMKHYENNVIGTLRLLKTMLRHNCQSLVFSSSAAIYGDPEYLPIDEKHPKNPMNAYGRTKWIVEQLLADFYNAHGLSSVSLRYFNAAGADPDGEIGGAHRKETHLIPRVLSTTQGKQPHFCLYADSLNTPDGTAIRDYIHVTDLAKAHLQALDWMDHHNSIASFNLGTGKGHSILEVIQAAESITGTKIDIKVQNRNLPESPILIADPTLAHHALNWTPEYSSLETILTTAWNWHNSPLKAAL